jgi:hypothetical protein
LVSNVSKGSNKLKTAAQNSLIVYMAQEERIAKGTGPEATVAKKTPKISRRRLQVVITGLWLCLFISAIDTTIITTSLIKISSGFNALEQGAWLVTAYLLTYECKDKVFD